MKLSQLLRTSEVSPVELVGDTDIESVSMDSRQVQPGALFVCMPSKNADTQGYIVAAAERGAVAAVVFDPRGIEFANTSGIAAVRLSNEGLSYNEALWRLCRTFFNCPTHSMKVVGVTGTNGKTTTAWLMRDMMVALK